MYKCKKCNKKFVKRYSYIGHCSVHNRNILLYKKIKIIKKNHNCKFCNKHFDSGCKLGGHIVCCKLNPSYNKRNLNISKSLLGNILSKKHRKKISKSLTKYLISNPDKVPYRLNHSSKRSYFEIIFENALKNNGFIGWVSQYRNSIYQYDFAFPDLKIDVEIDGTTHNLEKVKIIDKRRDIFSKNNGWKILRFTTKDIKENIIQCINILKNLINTIACSR